MLQGALLEAKITRSLASFKHLDWLFFKKMGSPKNPLPKEYEELLQF